MQKNRHKYVERKTVFGGSQDEARDNPGGGGK